MSNKKLSSLLMSILGVLAICFSVLGKAGAVWICAAGIILIGINSGIGFFSSEFWYCKEKPCKYHFWRPAIKETWNLDRTCREDHPAKVCEDCGRIEILTDAEFYSQFGKMPSAWRQRTSNRF